MSRRPTRQLSWEFVLRTFKRVDMIASRISAEALAKEILAYKPKASCPHEYLSDVWYHMLEHAKATGVDLHAHPNGNCPECGRDIGRDHNGARYCSTACRQRAYRVRKAAGEGRNSPIAKRSRPRTVALVGGEYELRLKKPRRRKKGSAGLQSDTSIIADDKTNVT